MHDIEPHFKWRDRYTSQEDDRSPFYGREYSEFEFSNKIYNYFIHPQWDEIGSPTLYAKQIFTDYDLGFAIVELIGEWNDLVHNDIMFLKRNFADALQAEGISKFIFIAENVLTSHLDDDSYYQEWLEDVSEEQGFIAILNMQPHVQQDFDQLRLHNYISYRFPFTDVNWRIMKPEAILEFVESCIFAGQGRLHE